MDACLVNRETRIRVAIRAPSKTLYFRAAIHLFPRKSWDECISGEIRGSITSQIASGYKVGPRALAVSNLQLSVAVFFEPRRDKSSRRALLPSRRFRERNYEVA